METEHAIEQTSAKRVNQPLPSMRFKPISCTLRKTHAPQKKSYEHAIFIRESLLTPLQKMESQPLLLRSQHFEQFSRRQSHQNQILEKGLF